MPELVAEDNVGVAGALLVGATVIVTEIAVDCAEEPPLLSVALTVTLFVPALDQTWVLVAAVPDARDSVMVFVPSPQVKTYLMESELGSLDVAVKLTGLPV